MEKLVLVNIFGVIFFSSFTTSSVKICEFNAGNAILFHSKETTLARYLIKETARPSLTQLKIIRQVEFIKC